jgi:hypothetical protein
MIISSLILCHRFGYRSSVSTKAPISVIDNEKIKISRKGVVFFIAAGFTYANERKMTALYCGDALRNVHKFMCL